MEIVRPWIKALTPTRLLALFIAVAILTSVLLVRFGGSDFTLLILMGPILLAAHFGEQRYYLVGLFVLTLLSIWVILSNSPQVSISLSILVAIVTGVFVAAEGIYQLSRRQQQTLGGLYASQRWFRSIFADSPIAIQLFGGDGRLLDMNRAALEIFGVSSVEAVKGFQIFDDPNITTEAKERLRRGETVRLINHFDFASVRQAKLYETKRDGIAELDVLVTPLEFHPNRPTEGYLVLAQDITEQVHQKRALEESEAKLRAIFNASDDGIILSDEIGKIIEFSQGMERITGWTRADMLGKSLWEMEYQLLPATIKAWLSLEDIRHHTQAILQGGSASLLGAAIEKWLVQRNGEHKVVELQSFAIATERGLQLGGICHDISERHRSAAALRESEERYRVLAEMSSDSFAILRIGEDGKPARVWSTDAAFIRLTGYTLDELATFSPDLREIVVAEDRLSVQMNPAPGLGVVRQEFRITRKDGEIRWIRQRYFFDHDDAGRPTLLYLAAEDVTDLKNVEQQALAFRLEKEQTRILTAFIQDASHEFRTPLSVLGLDLHYLQRNGAGTQTSRLTRMQDQVKIIGGLVDALLTLSTLDSEAPLNFTSVNIGALLADLISQRQVIAQNAGITLTLNMAGSLPELYGAPDYLLMALQCLVDNALRYTAAGGQVTVRTQSSDAAVQISVTDTGVGMSPEILPRIFERFYRLDEAHSTQGFGLGLSIAQKVAERHCGRILVESTPGQGSVFVLELPLLPVKCLQASEGSALT